MLYFLEKQLALCLPTAYNIIRRDVILMMNKSDAVEDLIIASGIGVSLVDIQTVMSIILLSFNIIWLCAKFGLKLYKYLKNDGKLDKEELDDLINDAEEIKDKVGDNK